MLIKLFHPRAQLSSLTKSKVMIGYLGVEEKR
jgi:hypothetical protein